MPVHSADSSRSGSVGRVACPSTAMRVDRGLIVVVVAAITATQREVALATPPCGIVLLNNTDDFLVSAYSYLNISTMEKVLQAADWNASVSSVIAGCGGSLVNGTFVPVSGDKLGDCRAAISALGARGVCWESRIYVEAPREMHAAAGRAGAVAAAVANHAQRLGLSGVSFDWEKKGEKVQSHRYYLQVTRALQAALHPIGVRVSSFSDNFYHDIRSFKDLGWNNDKVMCGETYIGNPGRWREQYHRILAVPDRAKMSPTLQCDTKHGNENCSPGQIRSRTELIAKNFTELSVFSLNGFGGGHLKVRGIHRGPLPPAVQHAVYVLPAG